MKKEELTKLINDLNLEETIEIDYIPNLDLYMDQVITLFEEKLAYTKRYDECKLLTKTMINNYIKDKVLMPAVKKKYTKEHILLMILLYDLKQILTITDIKKLFETIIQDGNVDSELLIKTYDIFTKFKLNEAREFNKEINRINDNLEDEVLEENIGEQHQQLLNTLRVILFTEKANYYKRLAEKILDDKINNL